MENASHAAAKPLAAAIHRALANEHGYAREPEVTQADVERFLLGRSRFEARFLNDADLNYVSYDDVWYEEVKVDDAGYVLGTRYQVAVLQ